jgi:hypothetical protein
MSGTVNNFPTENGEVDCKCPTPSVTLEPDQGAGRNRATG